MNNLTPKKSCPGGAIQANWPWTYTRIIDEHDPITLIYIQRHLLFTLQSIFQFRV